GPLRVRISGRWLGPSGATCRTTNTAADKSAGRPRTRALRASTPPADAPIRMMSRPVMRPAFQGEIRNPKYEIRNKFKGPNPKSEMKGLIIPYLDFEIVSDFGFRISDSSPSPARSAGPPRAPA